MRIIVRLIVLFAVCAVSVKAQNGCGNTLNWTSATCQTIGAGSIDTATKWTVVSRHGEWAQGETECNIPSAITQAPGLVTITTSAVATTCNDFSPTTGTACSSAAGTPCPQSFPFTTGTIQWKSLSIAPSNCGGVTGCVPCGGTCKATAVVAWPPATSNTWPSIWWLGQNCQDSNKYSGDTGLGDGCPTFNTTGYDEIDWVEAYNTGNGNWGATTTYHNAGETRATNVYSLDTAFHTFEMDWSTSQVVFKLDGVTQGTTTTNVPTAPMFFIALIQTGGIAGTPTNLPTTLQMKSLLVTDASNNPIFSDTFSGGGGGGSNNTWTPNGNLAWVNPGSLTWSGGNSWASTGSLTWN